MMNLHVSFQSLLYCFVFGFLFTGIYHVFNRITYHWNFVFKILLQIGLGVIFSFCFLFGLVLINDGVLRVYFFVFLFLGYVFFQRYYSYFLLVYLEKVIRIYRRIIQPYVFFFKRIDAIMEKKVKWVKKKWQKRKNSNSKS